MLNFFKPKAAAPSTAKRKTPEQHSSLANGKAMPAAKVQKRQPLQQRQAPTASSRQAANGFHTADQPAAPMVIDLDEPTDPAHHPSCASAPSSAPLNDDSTPIDHQKNGGAAAITASSQQQQQQDADSSLPSSINPDTGPLSDPGHQGQGSSEQHERDPGHGIVDVVRRSQLGPPLPNGVSRQHADSLIAMGFSQAQASRALLATQGDLPRAINWILQS